MVEQEPNGDHSINETVVDTTANSESFPKYLPKSRAELALYTMSAALTYMAVFQTPDIETKVRLGLLATLGLMAGLGSRKKS